MAKEILMTQQGFEDLRKELEFLKGEKRSDISEKIRVARGFGDLSENSEYDEAKNEQAIVEARILVLESQLKHIKIIKQSEISADIVSIGSRVTIKDVEYGDEVEYRIASSVESNSAMDTITDESPVGRALMKHRVGDFIDVTVPSGAVVRYEITHIKI